MTLLPGVPQVIKHDRAATPLAAIVVVVVVIVIAATPQFHKVRQALDPVFQAADPVSNLLDI